MHHKADLLTSEEASAWLQSRKSCAISELRDLVSLNSLTINVEGVNRVQARIAERFEGLGLRCVMATFRDRGSIVEARTESYQDNSASIVLIGHADTVHPEDSVPHTLRESDGKLYGPGAFDMKSGLVTIGLALEALHQANLLQRFPLKIVINSAEEAGSPETKAFMARCAEGARAALVFEFGRDGGGIVVSRKGMFTGDLSITGKSAHAGNSSHLGASATEELTSFINPIPKKIRSVDPEVTFNLGIISGGTARNVIAEKAEAMFEVRGSSTHDLAKARRILAARVRGYDGRGSISLNLSPNTPALEETIASLKLAESYQRAARKAGLSPAILPRQGGLSDANWVGSAGVPVIDGLGPLGGGAHTKDEFVEPQSIFTKALALIYFLIDQPEVRSEPAKR